MLKLKCPYCQVEADETELTNHGEAHIVRKGPGTSDEEFEAYMFLRDNPRGIIFERWRHAMGCGKWFHVARCTNTLEVFGTYSAQTLKPPKRIINAIKKRRPQFELSQR
ncbi:MAG: sarcosine oxidase subunit delta [Rhodobacteraceae bacterium]|nr:sarcosine oxidase subunit delta [Paracoccaceae bacterium]